MCCGKEVFQILVD